jgi:ribosomal protein S18 acetylase RimI-like enzyme
MESKPTNEQAQLHLQVYDLRREARLRQARDWFQQNYNAETVEEAMRIAAPGTEGGTFFGMVIGYWEQACALLNYGLLHEDLFFQTSGEFFAVHEQVKAVLPQFRQQFHEPHLLENLEKTAKRYEEWSEKRSPGHIAMMRQFMQQERAKAKTAAKA